MGCTLRYKRKKVQPKKGERYSVELRSQVSPRPKKGIKVQPKKGCALIWSNCSARGQEVVCDVNTEHAGLPPLKGEKFGLNFWARSMPYR